MKQQVLTERIKLYLFDDMMAFFGVNFMVAVIEEEDTLYVIDTYLGIEPMREVMKHYPEKPVIVINTHSDFDHIWGNAFFTAAPIYASQNYPQCFASKSAKELKKYKRFQREVPSLRPADHWVEDELRLGPLLLFNTPGHTMDSLSIFDETDQVLFTGDNLFAKYRSEAVDKAVHLKSLRRCLEFDFKYVVPSHIGTMHREDILKAIEILEEQ